jgi:hypothetical protein
VLALVRRARRRLFYNELFAQGANASSAALLAFILLLILGAEILAWQIVIVIPVVTFAAGLYIARRRLATPYAAAQKIDRRLGLADTLSTALYFSENASKADPDVVRSQSADAERLAESIDIHQAVPFTMPRTAYAMAALFLVAGSLFALRYGISRRLDLQQPLAAMLQETFGFQPKQQAKAKDRKVPPPDIAPDSELASAVDKAERAGDPMDSPNEQGEEMTEGQPGKADSRSADNKNADNSQQAESTDDESAEDRDANEGQAEGKGQQSGKQDGKEGNGKQDAGNNSESSNSLMSKVKDAVQNLLSKMKPQPNQGGQQQSGEQNGQQQGKGQQQNAKQQQAKNGQQQGGQQQAEGQDGQAGDQSQQAQDQQGKGQGNSDSKQASKQPGSGVGSQDGEKRLKQAEQLAAMGKISEIIGKRSQNISGETTVEVQNTQQQLKTQYSNRAAQHSQAASEIGRDEIPVALQSYVESYFEAVRKTTPAASNKTAPAAPAKK